MFARLTQLVTAFVLALPAQAVEIEYIAHAAFRFTTAQGTRAVIDPYADKVWISYRFPRDLAADAVFISHAHYDHDGGFSHGRSFPFPALVPVYLSPGQVNVRDLRATGLASIHAGMGPGGRPEQNVIWMLEADGVRIAHIGDNRRLTQQDLDSMGRIDVLLLRRTGKEDVTPEAMAELELIRRIARPRVIIPMHYRLPQFETDTSARGLDTVDAWLALQPGVRRLENNVVRVDAQALPQKQEVWLLPPSPLVMQ
jgi:L-ascorbate metabolism protein UlaG (beta-lactamase superfamily)